MHEFLTKSTIHAAPETVWEILTSAAGYAEWNPEIVAIEGRMAVGDFFGRYHEAVSLHLAYSGNFATRPPALDGPACTRRSEPNTPSPHSGFSIPSFCRDMISRLANVAGFSSMTK